MDKETFEDVEHLLDAQLANIRRTYEEAINAGCGDPLVWLFNLELEDSREVAIDILGEGLREDLKVARSPDVSPSCLMVNERQAAISTLKRRLRSTGAASMVARPQAPETIRVLVVYGPDAAVFDVPRSGGA